MTQTGAPKQNPLGNDYFTRIRNIHTYEAIEAYAKELTEQTGQIYIPYDYGSGRYPRYKAVALP